MPGALTFRALKGVKTRPSAKGSTYAGMSYGLIAPKQGMGYQETHSQWHPKNKAPVPGTPAPRPQISTPGPSSILQLSVELTAPMSSQVEAHLDQIHWFLKGSRRAEHGIAFITDQRGRPAHLRPHFHAHGPG